MGFAKFSTPIWFQLLKRQRDRKLTGFTPSFLIGASLPPKSTLDEEAAYGELVSLLSSFKYETPREFHVVIGKCGVHGQPIASFYDVKQQKPRCNAVLNHANEASSLYAESRYFGTKSQDQDSLVSGLWEVFKSPLINGEYSYRQNTYCLFSAEELQFIARARE